MAVEIPGLSKTFVAGADYSASANQYKFVKLSANNTIVLCAGTTDKPIGVLQNTPASGGAADVMLMGISKVQGDVDLAYADLIGTSADGQAAVLVAGTDTTKYVVGTVLVDNSAAAGLITAAINCINPHRAA